MDTCSRIGCDNEATHVPKIIVPFFNLLGEHEGNNSGILGLKLCEDHVKMVDVKDFPNLKEVFASLTSDQEGADWDKAYFTDVALTSAEYELFINPPKITPPPIAAGKGMMTPTPFKHYPVNKLLN